MRHAKALALGMALTGTALYALGDNPWQLLPLALVSAAHVSVARLPMTTAALAGAAFAADSALDPVHGPSPVTLIAFTNVLYQAHTHTTHRGILEIAGVVCVVGGAATAGILGSPPRAAMARDLHDVVAGHLTGIALQSEAALAAPTREHDREILAGIRAASLESLTQMRTLIDLIRNPQVPSAPEIATTPGIDDLPTALALARAAGLDVRHEPTQLPPPWPPSPARPPTAS